MLKLYYCVATAAEYDLVEIIIAESEEEAIEKFSIIVDESSSWFAGISVHELNFDDYDIIVNKKFS